MILYFVIIGLLVNQIIGNACMWLLYRSYDDLRQDIDKANSESPVPAFLAWQALSCAWMWLAFSWLRWKYRVMRRESWRRRSLRRLEKLMQIAIKADKLREPDDTRETCTEATRRLEELIKSL